MIAAHLEPIGLAPDAEPFADDYLLVSRNQAKRGSIALRDAILIAQGIDPPPPEEPTPTLFTFGLCPSCRAPMKPDRMLISHIQAVVSAYYGIPLSSMTSAQQYRKIAHARHIAMYLAGELTEHALAEIGRRFKRDHTTVIYAVRAVKKRIASNADTALDVEMIRQRLGG